MKKIAIVTSTRAEYGILYPLIQAVNNDPDCCLDLIVTGTHLSHKHGYTLSQIKSDGVFVTHTLPILEEGNTAFDISKTMANALQQFAACFREDRPDMVVVLGDRTEMLSVVAAATNENIPIAHIHGGEITQGAVDDCIRHAISKMSHLHFASTETYRRRLIQMGEQPQYVYNVGALSTENILHAPLMSETAIREELSIPDEMPFTMVTFHPVTREGATEKQTQELCRAILENPSFYYVITAANADAGGDTVNTILADFAKQHNHVSFVSNLGMIRYLSAVKYATFVLGNSSSGIIEAPVLGTPTVNIGSRQQGRLQAETVFNCAPVCADITRAICSASASSHNPTLLYGDGHTSQCILAAVKAALNDPKFDVKKQFHDL